MKPGNYIPKDIQLVATLADELNPLSPVIMGGEPGQWIGKAASLGFNALELHWADPFQIPISAISDSCDRHMMKIAAFATGRAYVYEGLNLIDDDPHRRQKAVERLKSFVDAAAPYRAAVILGCIRGNLPAPDKKEEALEILAGSTKEVALYAEDKGVGLVFEAINRYENNYLNTAKETVEFIQNYRLPNTKLLLDTFHMNIEESDPVEAFIDSKELLGYVHIADNNRLFAGAGHIPLKKIVAALNEIDYKGCISAECLPLPDSEQALAGWMNGILSCYK